MIRKVALAAAILLVLNAGLRVCHADPPPSAAWELTFGDEFNGKTLDTDKWIADESSSHYRNRRAENVELANGVCRLVTRRGKDGEKKWTTAHLLTRNFRQKFGYFEVRMKLPAMKGQYLVLWISTDYGNPRLAHFFVDIARIHNSKQGITRVGTVRVSEAQRTLAIGHHQWQVAVQQWQPPQDPSKDYHLYAIQWNDKELIWYFDGRVFHRSPNPGCRHEAEIHLSNFVTGQMNPAADARDGASTEVDYVRVFKKLDKLPTNPDLLEGVQ